MLLHVLLPLQELCSDRRDCSNQTFLAFITGAGAGNETIVSVGRWQAYNSLPEYTMPGDWSSKRIDKINSPLDKQATMINNKLAVFGLDC